jgi:hypothetical protein
MAVVHAYAAEVENDQDPQKIGVATFEKMYSYMVGSLFIVCHGSREYADGQYQFFRTKVKPNFT